MKSNERLEFLGDAMLEIVVSDYLFHKYQSSNEGELTKLRSRIVSRKNLNEVANNIGLPAMLSKSSRIKAGNSSVGGNALEAIVGAMYLDKGYETTCKVLREKLLKTLMRVEDLEQREENFKSILLEWCQKDAKNLRYETLELNELYEGFEAIVFVDDVEIAKGTGRNKKSAEQEAAKEATRVLNIKV